MAKPKYYRNKIALESGGDIVEAESLWKLEQNNILILVDEDETVITIFTEKIFYEVKNINPKSNNYEK